MKANMRGLDVTIEVKELPEYNVAYVRYVGPYGQTALVPRLFGTLHGWAGPRGLIGPDTVHLLVAHDNPKITSESKLRLSACMTVPDSIRPEGEVGTMKIPGGKFAVGHFEIAPDQVGEAWNTVIGEWMPQSGFQPDDRLSYEVPLNNPAEHPQGKIIMNVCVPVRPL